MEIRGVSHGTWTLCFWFEQSLILQIPRMGRVAHTDWLLHLPVPRWILNRTPSDLRCRGNSTAPWRVALTFGGSGSASRLQRWQRGWKNIPKS